MSIQEKEIPHRYACTYTPECDREATTTVVINGYARAVCEGCRRIEIRRQNTQRERQEQQRIVRKEKP